MKNLFPLILVLFSIINLNAQTPAKKQFPVGEQCKSVLNELSGLHQQTLKFFNEKDYDKAYPPAKKMSEIAETKCVNEKDKRLSIALMVAEIQAKRGKKDDVRAIFEKNLSLAGEVLGETGVDFDNYLTSLIKVSATSVNDAKFAELMEKSVGVKKNVFGLESYETARELLRTATVFRKAKKHEKAEAYYLEAVAVSDKMLSNEKVQKLSAVNQYRAYLIDRFGFDEGGKKDEEFMKNRPQVYTTADNRRVLNGMAVKLVKPDYNDQAFTAYAAGKVEVEILIGEDGRVIKAKAISGHPYLIPSSEQAAKGCIFLPTYVDGEPILVKGVIVYDFGNNGR